MNNGVTTNNTTQADNQNTLAPMAGVTIAPAEAAPVNASSKDSATSAVFKQSAVVSGTAPVPSANPVPTPSAPEPVPNAVQPAVVQPQPTVNIPQPAPQPTVEISGPPPKKKANFTPRQIAILLL